MPIQTQEIILGAGKSNKASDKPRTFCEIFRYQPDNIEQTALGSLFIVAQLTLIKDCGYLNNLLASLIKREYYLYPHKGTMKSFQSALKKANGHLAELAKQANTEWLGKLHFLCVAATDQELLFSQAGESRAYLFRQDHLTNLAKKIVPDSEKPHSAKIFSSLVCGKIEPGDKIILATPPIDELFSPAGLRQIIARQPNILGVAEQINKILREQDAIKQIAILLLEAQGEGLKTPPLPEPNRQTITPPIDLNEILK